MRNSIERNVKILVVFFCLIFFSIIFYLTIFNLFFADRINMDETNKRIKYAENEVLRGAIIDRNGKVIAYSKRISTTEQERIYNDGEVFSQIVGYQSKIYGKAGIEKNCNDILIRRNVENGILRSFFRGLKENVNNDEKKGNDIYLTIDQQLQKKAYEVLGNNKGAIVALNPTTGEILAEVSKPTFDSNLIDENYKEYSIDTEGTPLINRATKGCYPPGSTFKIITAASALENIKGIESKTFNCRGSLELKGYRLKCFNGEVHGMLELPKAFEESCNFTFGSLGIELGYDKMKKTAEAFMFNKSIVSADQYDSLNIRSGSFEIENKAYKGAVAQNAIGQNMVAANPMQMALVAGAIANDGVMMKPYLIAEVKDRYGALLDKIIPQVMSVAARKEVAQTVKKYMLAVVEKGTGTKARIKGIKVAGKTGTAENLKGKSPHSWFVAFAPYEKPRIAIAVIIENGGTGGNKAAKAAREVIKDYLQRK